ncbi:hypothetical protein ACHAWF_007759 [Thalassiosira exigua]
MSSRPRNSSSETSKPKKRKRDQPPRPQSQSGDDREWFFPFTKNDPLYVDYMTNEWGFEKQTDQELFENLCLEGAQSGLSWRTILHKRSAYRKAFHGFEIDRVASMTGGSMNCYLKPRTMCQNWCCIPSTSEESECMSKSLKKHGFKFVGPTTCYALMQSCGFVVDHPVGTAHWAKAERRLKKRKGGYQLR